MSIDKLNIRFNEPIYDQENIDKLKNKVNEIIDEVANVEEASIPKTKKLYYHGIEIFDSNTKVYLTLTIFNNTSEQINSWTKFKTILESFGPYALYRISGGYNYNSEAIVNAVFMYTTSTMLYLGGIKADGSIYRIDKTFVQWDAIFGDGTFTWNDRVNEIYPNISEE